MPDEVRLLDNGKAILFVRGERPMMDSKYDLKHHPNVRYTEDGGAPPYVHRPGLSYALDDLPPFKSLDDFEIYE